MTIPKITIEDLCAAGETSKFYVFCVFSFPLLLWKVEKRLLQKSLSCPEIPLCLGKSIPTCSVQAVVFVLCFFFFSDKKKITQIHVLLFKRLLLKSLVAGSGPRLFFFKAVGGGLYVML